MNYECGFCDRIMEKSEHQNKGLFDVYLCKDCIPGFSTSYRQLFYEGETELLATTIRIGEYFIVLNHAFSFTNPKSHYTLIYKRVGDAANDPLSLEPEWGPEPPVFELDFILELPLHDIAACRQKLSIYTTFS
jgi:hypothetical protein